MNAECGMRNAECGMRNAECGMPRPRTSIATKPNVRSHSPSPISQSHKSHLSHLSHLSQSQNLQCRIHGACHMVFEYEIDEFCMVVFVLIF
jgi:hypothetical protein